MLGFNLIGRADEGRAELHRAGPGSLSSSPPKGNASEGVSLYLRKPVPSSDPDSPAPKGSLWIEVDNVDDMHQEIVHKLAKHAQDLTDYFPAHHFGAAKVQNKPRNTGFGERQMTVVDDAGNTVIFFQVLET